MIFNNSQTLFSLQRLASAALPSLALFCGFTSSNLLADNPSRTLGFGRIAHWTFDADFSSAVNNDLYQGYPSDGDYVHIAAPLDGSPVGSNALRIESGSKSGNATFVDVRNPLFGRNSYDTFTVSAWYRFEDLKGDGSDKRNFVWESSPSFSLAFGLQADAAGSRDAEWWFLNRSKAALSDTSGPVIQSGEWHHVAMVWNRPAGRCRFYHNGELKDEVLFPDSTELEWMDGFHIGNHRAGNGERDWDGWIDDLAVFDLELTARQIRALYNRSINGSSVSAANVLQTVPEPETQFLVSRPDNLKAPKPVWDPSNSQGPVIGHVSETSAILWARIPEATEWTLTVQEMGSDKIHLQQISKADPYNDFCMRWEVCGLRSGTRYSYSIRSEKTVFCSGAGYYFETAPDVNQPNRTTLAFGSCAGFEDSAVWARMAEEGAEGVILMGDTPYIDTVELPRVRDAYRRFASVPKLAELVKTRPMWGTWDDHDFGRNDSDGTLPGKKFTRQGFVEYRPNANHGQDGQGIYTSFRRGPVEVFLIDARWFARTEKSWADPDLPTLLGQHQWAWLQEGLLKSTAPFKMLLTGMIWDDKENSESDDWGTYMHERLAIESWIGANKISGVILMGGDIHVSRHLIYPETQDRAGYILHQFITSPVHDGIIPSLNVKHPALVWSAEEPQTFLKIQSQDDHQGHATLTATWMNAAGETMHQALLSSEDLKARGATGPE